MVSNVGAWGGLELTYWQNRAYCEPALWAGISALDKSSASVRTRSMAVETAHIKAHLLLSNKSSKASKGLPLPFPLLFPPPCGGRGLGRDSSEVLSEVQTTVSTLHRKGKMLAIAITLCNKNNMTNHFTIARD